MISKFRRVIAAFSFVALVSVIAAAPSNAADAPTGVSTAGGGASLISVDYGDTLKALLLGETSSGSIDPVNGTPTATEKLSPLNVKSVTLPALNALTIAPVQTQTTNGVDSNSAGPIAINTAALGAVIDPATLTSTLDANGAKTSLLANLANLQVLGGVLGLHSSSLDLGGFASPTSGTASRALTADGFTVLDLRGVLNLLGLDLTDLTLGQLADLLDALGVLDLVPGNFANPAALVTGVTNANNAVDTAQLAVTAGQNIVNSAAATLAIDQVALGVAQAALDACIAISCGTQVALTAARDLAQTAVSNDQTALDAANAVLAALQNVLDQVQGLLDSLLGNIGDVLLGTPLLAVDGVQVGAVATAKDTIANSSATVTGLIKSIHVGGINIGAIDANTTLAQLTALASSATSAINTILTGISPQLGNLINVKLLQQATNVFQSGDYVDAVAGITGVIATIQPPDLCAVFKSLPTDSDNLPIPKLPSTPVPGVLTSLGSTIDPCVFVDANSADLQPAVQGLLPVLTNPITLSAASVNSVAEFKTVAAPATTPETPTLPRTGMNETLLLVVGGLMAAVALGLRKVSAPAKVRANRTKP